MATSFLWRGIRRVLSGDIEMEATANHRWPPLLSAAGVLVASFLFITLIQLRRNSRNRRSANYCPPCTYPVIGNLPAFLVNSHRFLDWAADLISASPARTIEVRGPLGQSPGVCTADPAVVDHLLRLRFSIYVKGDRYTSRLSDLLGRGIFNADAHLWAVQRKLASREFTTRSLRSFAAQVIRTETDSHLLPCLFAAAVSGDAIDLQDVLRRFAFDNICAVAFGTDPAALGGGGHQDLPFFNAFDDAVEISAARFFTPVQWLWKAKRLLNIGSERRLRDAIRVIDEYAMRIIASREEQGGSEKQDLLSRFVAAVNEDEGELAAMIRDAAEKRRFLRDIVVSFVLAGKDSTSSALVWFFWLVSANPRCERRILAELSELGDDAELVGYDDLKGLHYLHAAVSEALRLYPPVPIDSRLAVAEDVLPDGTRVRAGWFADYSAYAMARMEAVWGEDCREFVPERWLDGKGEFVPADPARFPVFHVGPRACLGREMAYVQMKSVAATVLRRFRVEPAAVGAAPPLYELSLTLRMKGGFPVRVVGRVSE